MLRKLNHKIKETSDQQSDANGDVNSSMNKEFKLISENSSVASSKKLSMLAPKEQMLSKLLNMPGASGNVMHGVSIGINQIMGKQKLDKVPRLQLNQTTEEHPDNLSGNFEID